MSKYLTRTACAGADALARMNWGTHAPVIAYAGYAQRRCLRVVRLHEQACSDRRALDACVKEHLRCAPRSEDDRTHARKATHASSRNRRHTHARTRACRHRHTDVHKHISKPYETNTCTHNFEQTQARPARARARARHARARTPARVAVAYAACCRPRALCVRRACGARRCTRTRSRFFQCRSSDWRRTRLTAS
eukprot:6212646-Pleurochrysis_carterae.AAC.2